MLRRLERRGKYETAHRAKQHVGQVVRYAIATGRAERDLKGDLRGALAPIKVTNRWYLSLMLANGRGVPRDFTAALGWSLAAQDNGVAQAAGVIDQLRRLTTAEQVTQAEQYVTRYGQAALAPQNPTFFTSTPGATLKVAHSIEVVFPDAATPRHARLGRRLDACAPATAA